MAKTGITTAQYLNYCQSGNERLIELLSKDFEDRTCYKSTRNPVAATWLISFRHISRDNQLAAQYLRFMSFLAEKEIPKSLLPLGNRDLEADEAIGTLKAYAFITERPGQESYDMHRLVRLAMRNWLAEEGELKACATTLIQHLDKVFPFPKHENRAVWVRHLPYTLTGLGFRDHSTDDAAKSSLLFKAAKSTSMLGKYQDAEALYRQTLKLQIRVLGAEYPDTLTSINNLANTLDRQGKYEEAEALYRQTLKLQTRVLGAEYPDTLTSINNLANTLDSINNLANTLYSQGKYEEAEALYRINNLANTLDRQGKYKEAEALYRQTLKLQTRVLGAEYPDTLASMLSVANILYRQGKYEEAEALYRQTLKLQTRGKYEEAEALYRQILKLRTRVLGTEHPDTLTSINNLANMLYRQGKYEEAEALYRQTLKL
ncbi:hypothetical protein MFIFM68171_00869 [Madurella fahalii]|uniref:Kinesin light chain n=1 Tax=Madurella fahalii TaxID=1157608 RepID=A0ABQ0FYU1_9PEZI